MTTPEPLGVIGHYNLLERLPPSGPGELFRARDTHRGRTVVIRLLPRDHPSDGSAREQLLTQARALAALSHPNIITVFEAGDHDGRLYLVFEFLRGQSLRAEMAGRPMNVRRSVEIAIQLSDAIAEAHAAGFVHGGLSPDSIGMTAKGHAKVPAFDLASLGGFDEEDGTARLRDYQSPEEARGGDSDDRSDIYSIGAVLYEMLTTRRPPHRGAAAPSAGNHHVPGELDDIVLKAVAPNPDSRYQSVATLAAELRSMMAVLDVRGVASDDDMPIEPVSVMPRVLATSGIALAVLALILWLVAGR